jgi:hypothetical protein
MADFKTIVEIHWRLLMASTPYPLPGAWAGLAGDSGVRMAPPDLAAWLEGLAADFPAVDLVAAGVAQSDANHVLTPSAALQAGTPLVFQCFRDGEVPLAVLTSSGMLSGNDLPIEAAFADAVTCIALRRVEKLFVAFSLEDVAVLRALELPATTAFGLERLTPSTLDALCKKCGWTRGLKKFPEIAFTPTQSQATSSSPEEFETEDVPSPSSLPIVLVGWSPAALQLAEPAGMKPVIDELCRLKEHLDLEDMDIAVWSPTAAFLERLSFRLQFGAVTAEEMLQSLYISCFNALFFFGEPLPAPAPPGDLVTATEEYRKAVRKARGASTEQVQRAQDAFHKRLEDLLEPLQRGSDGPLDRNLKATLVAVSRSLHSLTPLIDVGLTPNGAQDLKKYVDMVLALTKELRRTELHHPVKRPRVRSYRLPKPPRPGGRGPRFTGR